MTLDLNKLSPQIVEMVAKIKSRGLDRKQHLKFAMAKLCDTGIDLESLERKIASARTPNWSPAGLFEGLSLHLPPPEPPPDYVALATDGSHIDVDRHKAARCYLINTGRVVLGYGSNPFAELDNVPQLYSEDQDLVIRNENNKQQEQQVRGALLDARRTVEECYKLAELAANLEVSCPAIALMDGSLVMFGMQNYPEFVVDELVNKGLVRALDELRKLSESNPLTVASYISFPQSDDVINILRVAICPQKNIDCDRYCSQEDAACDAISGVSDRDLFSDLLDIGERSAVFIKPSSILKRYGSHHVYFFYLKMEDEIARIDIPEWVARNPDLLKLTHGLVLDQCRRGHGYPVALSEAHEKAVITGADREEFWSLVEEFIEAEKVPVFSSTKSRSKRTRWI